MTNALLAEWDAAMREMGRAWSSLGAALLTVSDWKTAIDEMANEMGRVKARGGWRTGR